MKVFTGLLPIVGAAILLTAVIDVSLVYAQVGSDSQTRGDRFRHRGVMNNEAMPRRPAPGQERVREALTGFDNVTNGFDRQGQPYDTLNEDNVVAKRSFNDNRFIFEEFETLEDGLGPTYNAQSCRECHQNVATGGASQVTEHRTGRLELDQFVESVSGSLIHSRATDPTIMERVAFEDDVRTSRISTNTFSNGYVEAISNTTLMAIRDAQPAAMRGTAIMVGMLEGDGTPWVGRFGWKNQHASLQDAVAEIHARVGCTVLMITHDVDHAVFLSDRIVMMTNGPSATIGEIPEIVPPRPPQPAGDGRRAALQPLPSGSPVVPLQQARRQSGLISGAWKDAAQDGRFGRFCVTGPLIDTILACLPGKP